MPTLPLGYTLKRVVHSFRLQMDDALRPFHLTAASYAALFHLRLNPGLPNAELARKSFVTPQTMIRVVKGLETQNLITRTQGTGRTLEIHLTPKGTSTLQKSDQKVLEVEANMTKNITPQKQQQLHNLLMTCLENLS